MAGCTADPGAEPGPFGENPPTAENPHAVPVEQALEELQSVLEEIDTPAEDGAVTRSEATADVEDLLYIVNFENEAGYAILGADDRLEPVYAVVDEGSLTTEDFRYAVTVTPEQAEADGELVFPLQMVAQAALGGIGTGGTGGGGIGGPITDIGHLGPTGGPTLIGTELGPWTNEEYVPNMLKTKWGQSNPYNIRVPNGTDPTGCTPVAIAQLLTYNKFYYNRAPDVISSATIQWDLIKQAVQTPSLLKATPYNDPTISVAWLIRLIGRAAGTDYGASGSSTKRRKAVNLMEQWYRNVYREDVSETYVRRMIFERRLPAIIMGRNTNGDGHSWVADGWLYRTRIVYSVYNDGSKKKYMT